MQRIPEFLNTFRVRPAPPPHVATPTRDSDAPNGARRGIRPKRAKDKRGEWWEWKLMRSSAAGAIERTEAAAGVLRHEARFEAR